MHDAGRWLTGYFPGGATARNLDKLGDLRELDFSRAFFTNIFPGLRKGRSTGSAGVFTGSDFHRKSVCLFRYTLELLSPQAIVCLGRPVARFIASIADGQLKDWWSSFAAIDKSTDGPVIKLSRLSGQGPITVVAMTHPSIWSNLGKRPFQGMTGPDACAGMLAAAITPG